MIKLRRAEHSDIELLYEWVNDPAVRKNSFHSDLIPYDIHKIWFHKMMEDASVFQFILMDEYIPVGQIRISVDGEVAEIGYSIASEYRGKGYGHKILRLAAKLVETDYPQIKKLVAKVKPENVTSRKLFESEGYVMKYSCYSLEI